MDLKQYYVRFGADELKRLAEAVDTSYAYLLQIKNGHRHPSRKLAWMLHVKSKHKVLDFEKLLK